MSDITRKRNDTTPITGTLTANGEVVDLSQARKAWFRMRRDDSDGELKTDGDAEIVTPADGIVRYSFDASDVDESGFYVAEWEVEYADYTKQTFPNAGYLSVRITDDLQ